MTGRISKKVLSIMMLTALMACLVIPAQAKVPMNMAIMLKNGKLTPVGANPMGNEAGTIPAWEGGITEIPKQFNWDPKSDERRPDPYADDKILFTITAQNVDQYADKLNPGTLEMFRLYPDTFKMHVYPTRRSAGYSETVYKGTYENALSAELINGGADGVTNYGVGFMFPIPNNGAEAIYNYLYRVQGVPGIKGNGNSIIVYQDHHTLSLKPEEEYFYLAEMQPKKKFDSSGWVNGMLIGFLDPPGRKGELLLAVNPSDFRNQDSTVWMYMPGQRRVRRAPNYAYDGEDAGNGGLCTIDDTANYFGRPDRFDFTLKGKKELFIPYNCYQMDLAPDADTLLTPNHLNPEFIRWELHRVWEVEATLKEGYRHCYGKRVFYLDEDSWLICAKDNYDNRGNIWRMGYMTSKQRYDYPAYHMQVLVHYDNQTDKYLVNNIAPGFPRQMAADIPLSHFTPQYIRNLGKR